MIGAVLLAGCSQDDVAIEVTPEEPVALNFCITEAETNYTDGSTRAGQTASTRAGHTGAMDNEDLYTTGFGIFASVTAGTPPTYDNKPNLMYNQEVEYTHVGDMETPLTGYWSYQPVKYWPTDLTHCYISAYAPYQELPIDGSGTGIYGLSDNSEAPYVDYRRCEQPNEVVDLLWYYEEPAGIPAASAGYAAGTLRMKMRHALTRLEINVKLASAPAEGTKVLIDSIALTGTMAKTGRLSLSTQETEGEGLEKKYYPVWSDQINDKDGGGGDTPHTFVIDNDDNNALSYGIIDPQVRYIKGLPYAWQPDGLKDEGLQNALSTGDRKTYIYLIPQDAPLNLTVKVRYHKMTAGSDEMRIKTTTEPFTAIGSPVDNPTVLRGNTTYSLNLTLTLSDI